MKNKLVSAGERPVFIDIKSDFGFKRCMGDEIVMKSFLNAILSEDYGRIEKIQFKNVELPKERRERHGVRFDLRCELDNGDEVLIEMQNYAHRYFKTRANYYLCRLMTEIVPSDVVWSKMGHDIPRLIGIFIMGVPLEGLTEAVTVTSEFDVKRRIEFWGGIRKYYISLPEFKLDENTRLSEKEIWMELIKNLGTMNSTDVNTYELADEGLRRLIDKARVAKLSDQELAEYEAAMKDLSDYGTAEAYGFDNGFRRGLLEGKEQGIAEGRAEGMAQGKAEGMAQGAKELSVKIACLMMAQNEPLEKIALYTGLTEEELKELAKR